MKKIYKQLLVGLFALGSFNASATILTFFDTISDGQSQYASVVTGAGGTFNTTTLAGMSAGTFWDFGDFTITSSTVRSIDPIGTDSLTGQSISGNGFDTNFITFSFASGINGFGFELGDWGTCCFPSSVFLSFDGNPAQIVGTMTEDEDNPNFPDNDYFGKGIFVGAIDDSDFFNTITFRADQGGDVFEAGGTIYYSASKIGSIGVPEPTTLAIFALGLIGLASRRFNK